MSEEFYKQFTEPTLGTGIPSALPEKVGPYKIEALLSKGGMSWLYMGIHPDTKKPIAIKVLPTDHIQNEEAVNLFLKESRIIALTDHPNIVKLYGEGTWEEGLYIAMEWVHGISLRQFLSQQSFSLKRSLDIILQVAFALKHLHSHGIIHRDLKPENVLISEDGVIKVIDFGIAQLVKESTISKTFSALGTPNYMSPEQKENPHSISYPSDIYSLGILAYELILGKPCYGIIQTKLLPQKLGKIIGKALAISICNRYQHIEEFIKDLSDYRKSEEIEKEKPEQDEITEILEIFQKASFSLSPFPLPIYPPAQIGLAKIKSKRQFGLYYDFILLPQDTCLLFIADPLTQDLQSLFSSANLRGVIRTLISTIQPFSPLAFAEALHQALQQDPFIASFSVSYLYLNPLESKAHFFNANLSNLLYVPAGGEVAVVISDNGNLAEKQEGPLSEQVLDWKTGDILIFHTLTSKLEQADLILAQLKQTLKKELFLSAQAQAEAILKETLKNPLLNKNQQARVLFSLQRVE